MRDATYHRVVPGMTERDWPPAEALEAFWDEMIADTDRICEAIGPDGLQYPFCTRFIGLSDVERRGLRQQVRAFDDAFYREVGDAIRNDDAAELGRLIMNHAKPYLEDQFNDWLEDNAWRFYE